jgi:uncharacterized protein (AIM24 family)
MREHDKDEQDPKGRRRHGEEIDGRGLRQMIRQEGSTETSPPAGPESVQHNPQEPVAPVEAQATRRVLLENRKLVAKREDLRLQGSTGSKTGGY